MQLLDPRTVARPTHAAESYPFEDVGRLRAHAKAHACHQINPGLEIKTIPKRSLGGIDAGDAVFCCPVTRGIWRSLRRSLRPSVVFARCDVIGNQLRLDVARGVSVVTDWVDRLASLAEGAPSSPHPAIPVQVATVAAASALAPIRSITVTEATWRTGMPVRGSMMWE